MNNEAKKRISLPRNAAMQLAAYPYEQDEIARQLQSAIDLARTLLMVGYSIDLPGLGVIEPYTRPARRVRANFHGPDAPVYHTGPRFGVRLQLHEALRKRVNRQLKQLDEWAANLEDNDDEVHP